MKKEIEVLRAANNYNRVISSEKYHNALTLAIRVLENCDEGKITRAIIQEIHGIKYPRPHLMAKALVKMLRGER